MIKHKQLPFHTPPPKKNPLLTFKLRKQSTLITMSRVYDNLDRLSQEFSTEDHIKHSNDINRIRSASKRSSSRSFISRSVRAKRRRAFLRTYQLSSLDTNSVAAAESSNCQQKLRQAAIKLKSVVVSWAAAARLRLRRCSLRPFLCSSVTPSPSIRLA